jgi:tight adherence protein C
MIAAGLAFLSVALAGLGVATLASGRDRTARGRRGVPRVLDVLARAGAPVSRRPGLRAPRGLEARIEAAGRPGGLGERELMAAKLASALAAGAAAAPLSASAPGRLGPLMVAAGPIAGFLAPDLWLARRARARARRVRRELPAMLDLLRVTVEAGLSLPAALAEVGGRTRGPLAREWRTLAREAELGVPLGEAIRIGLGRLPLAETQAFAAAVERALKHGAPLADTLTAQARDARAALRRRVHEEAGRAGPKIQLVVALLLVPSVLLLVAAALIAALLTPGAVPGGK